MSTTQLRAALALFCVGLLVHTLASAARLPAAFAFDLEDSGGVRHTATEWSDARAVVLFFLTPDCPVSQAYVPEMNRIRQAYAARGVQVYGVQSDLSVSTADVRRHVAEYGYAFPILLDRHHQLVRHVNATVTPEAVVLTPSGDVRYQGRIDDRVPALGVRRPYANRHELRDALDAVLDGRPVSRTGPPAVGCFIVSRP